MKRLVLFFLLSLVQLAAYSQNSYKLVEKSAKEKPSWMTNGNTYGAFFIQANKVATLEDAQNSVMTSLMNQIASSISVQVIGEVVKDIDWTVVDLDGKTQDQYIETIRNNTTVKISKMPALQGFSITKANIYWERYINKKTKETCYDYYMLYPFSPEELQELIDEYNAQEEAINDKINKYREDLEGIDDIDVLLEYVSQMNRMKKEMVDDKEKCDKLTEIIKLYEKTIKNIYIEVVENYNENNKGTLVVQLKHDDKIMKTKSLPQLKGICARDFSKKHSGNQITITFNTFDCYEQDDNYVEVRFTFGKVKLNNKINIKL